MPYASMGVRLGTGPQIMIILAGDAGGQQLWTSAAKIAMTTQNGRIVRTAGFGHDLGGYYVWRCLRRGEWFAAQTRALASRFPGSQTVFRSDPVPGQAEAGEETIAILGKDIRTLRIDESCSSQSSQLDWSFENTYWVDPANGLVWRSIQHVHPQLDAIETEILRPPL